MNRARRGNVLCIDPGDRRRAGTRVVPTKYSSGGPRNSTAPTVAGHHHASLAITSGAGPSAATNSINTHGATRPKANGNAATPASASHSPGPSS